MKKMKKVLALTACAAMLVVGSVAGTLAYLTAQDTVTNTFTVGKVKIALDEADVDEYGQLLYKDDEKTELNDRVKANGYKLVPGCTYTKDPTVTVEEKSEEAYVYMTVTVDYYNNLISVLPNDGETKKYYNGNVFLLQYLCDWKANSPWKYKGCEVKNVESGRQTAEYRFVYDKDTSTNVAIEPTAYSDSETKLPPLFKTINLPGEYVNSDNIATLAPVAIHVNAYAVQKASFDDYNKAWAAGFGTSDTDVFDK